MKKRVIMEIDAKDEKRMRRAMGIIGRFPGILSVDQLQGFDKGRVMFVGENFDQSKLERKIRRRCGALTTSLSITPEEYAPPPTLPPPMIMPPAPTAPAPPLPAPLPPMGGPRPNMYPPYPHPPMGYNPNPSCLIM